MRGLAKLAMRGPKQAVMLSVLFASIPMLFWLSGAIVSLVILRRGFDQGLKVLMWALLPGIAWAAMGQYSVVLGLLVTVSLASVLRLTVSWPKVLLALLPAGGALVLVQALLMPDQLAQLTTMVTELLTAFLAQAGKTPADLGEALNLRIHYGVIGVLAWFNLVSSILGLILARSWQSWLYNPGGFREEFHWIHLPALYSLALLTLTLAGAMLSPAMVVLVPIASLPLFIAGVSLAHGLVGLKNLGFPWLVAFYLMVMLFTQLAYPVVVLIACLDSLYDVRTRIANKAHSG